MILMPVPLQLPAFLRSQAANRMTRFRERQRTACPTVIGVVILVAKVLSFGDGDQVRSNDGAEDGQVYKRDKLTQKSASRQKDIALKVSVPPYASVYSNFVTGCLTSELTRNFSPLTLSQHRLVASFPF